MTAAPILAELEELERFLVATHHRGRYGELVCLAEHPETVNGSPETLVTDAVEAGAVITGGWAEKLVAELEGRSTPHDISWAITRAGQSFDLKPFAELAEQQILRGLMLGALDSQWERDNDAEVGPARFRDAKAQPIVYAPFTKAIELFEQKQVLPPAAFAKLKEGAKQKAFTIAGLAKEELLTAAHAELLKKLEEGRQLEGGPDLRSFQKFAKERLEKAGWTPANKSHVETIYRTNIVSAYGNGRAVEMSQPKVLKALPYWQIRGVKDARQRETHRKADGIVLPANHEFWKTAYPPFGFNCRCRVVSRSESYLKAAGLTVGPVPQGLPDPGFESGLRSLIQVPAAALEQAPAPQPAPVVAPAPAPLPPLPPPVIEPPPTPPVLPPPKIAPPPEAIDFLAKKVGDASGSNPGGIYQGSDGVKRYVKFYTDPAQAAGEHLANSLYRDLGLAGPESTIFLHEGKLAYASEILPGMKTLGSKLSPELAKKALEGFSADVLMANWDAAGLTLDNMLVNSKGRIVRIDNGAAFLTRAKGARKPLSTLGNVTEWESFFSAAKNPGYAKLATEAGVTSATDLAASIKRGVTKIKKVRDEAGGWRAYVEAHSQGLSVADREQIIGMLETRTTFLEQKVADFDKLKKLKKKGARVIGQLPKGTVPAAKRGPVPGLSKAEWEALQSKRLALLTHAERNAIVTYSGAQYSRIRDANFLTPEQWYDKWSKLEHVAADDYVRYRQLADHIDTAFWKLSNVEGAEAKVTEVYRGMRQLSPELVTEIINSKGFEWQALTSTSWSSAKAENFSVGSSKSKMGIMFVMQTRTETAARRLGMETISQVAHEKEIMLARGSRFRITNVQQLDEQRLIVYGEELLPGETLAGTVKLTA